MTTFQVSSHQLLEVEPHLFVAEASELRLPVGVWPLRIDTSLGNGQPLERQTKKVDADGDILYVRYRQRFGCVNLKIFND